MERRECYLDLIPVPLGLLINGGVSRLVVAQRKETAAHDRDCYQRFWTSSMMKENDTKNILAVQTLRSTIMGSTLMATTSILLCLALAAFLCCTYSVKKPLNKAVYGEHGEFLLALKYIALLAVFLFAFLCHSLSFWFINQVHILINCPQVEVDPGFSPTPEYDAEILERGFTFNAVENRIFYVAMPLLLWIFGPMLVFFCSVTLVPVLYNLDFMPGKGTTVVRVRDTRKNVGLA